MLQLEPDIKPAQGHAAYHILTMAVFGAFTAKKATPRRRVEKQFLHRHACPLWMGCRYRLVPGGRTIDGPTPVGADIT